ncbi:hypothetical protein GCM10010458_15820 [Microbacterium luteolum]
MNRTAVSVYHQVAVTPRVSETAPGLDTAGARGSMRLLTLSRYGRDSCQGYDVRYTREAVTARHCRAEPASGGLDPS